MPLRRPSCRSASPSPHPLAWIRTVSGAQLRRILFHWTLVLSLLSTFILISVDHHGAERIPTHQHGWGGVDVAIQHVHGFELAHRHEAGVAPSTAPTAWFSSVSLDLQVTSVVALTALLALAWGLLRHPRAPFHVLTNSMDPQFKLRPPVPPPTW
jgi:hypothetical protein